MLSPIPSFKELEGFSQEEPRAFLERSSGLSRLVNVLVTTGLFALLVALKLAADAFPAAAQQLLTSVITTTSNTQSGEARSPDRAADLTS